MFAALHLLNGQLPVFLLTGDMNITNYGIISIGNGNNINMPTTPFYQNWIGQNPPRGTSREYKNALNAAARVANQPELSQNALNKLLRDAGYIQHRKEKGMVWIRP